MSPESAPAQAAPPAYQGSKRNAGLSDDTDQTKLAHINITFNNQNRQTAPVALTT